MSNSLKNAMKVIAHEFSQKLLPNVEKEKEDNNKLNTLMHEKYDTEETKQYRELAKEVDKQFKGNRILVNAYTGEVEVEKR